MKMVLGMMCCFGIFATVGAVLAVIGGIFQMPIIREAGIYALLSGFFLNGFLALIGMLILILKD